MKEELSFGNEMYEALKAASVYIQKHNGILCNSIEFNDNEKKLFIEPTDTWFLISLGYHAHRIMNNLKA